LAKDNVVEILHQYLYNNQHRLGHVVETRDGEGGHKYEIKSRPSSKEMLGEYDETTQTYYISIAGFKTIAKELEKERTLLINALVKAGVMEKESISYYSKITKSKIRVYKLKFPETPPDQPPPDQSNNIPPSEPNNPEPNTTEPPPDNNHDTPMPFEPSDSENDNHDDSTGDTLDIASIAFDTQNSVKPHEKKQLPPATQLTDTKPPAPLPSVPEPTVTDNDEPINGEPQELTKQTIDETGGDMNEEQTTTKAKKTKAKEKIVIDENTLDIYDVKPRDQIPKYEIKPKNIKPFSELLVGSLDIESTGLEETDQIIAIAFNTYKNGELISKDRFYVNQYDNDDTKMVNAFLDKLKQSNIDVLTGYNLYDFDLQMIKAKDKNDRLHFTDPLNVSGAMLNNRQLQGYCIKVDGKYIEVIDAFHLVIKYDNIAREIPAQNYDLKSVAKHFGISGEDRVVLGADESFNPL